ncbi:DUF3006 family protein [Bacillus sp. FJAT-45037]|uniref:DUF3006 family protein n=1 Tax=Bacillus sp. FJAT-45037 TaxID=2011007 RepID=UPI001E307801|nr:DUF3006 family protein [Bacillus sp. FJAT-45037]
MLDRIVDQNVAVLLVGLEEKEYTLPVHRLPKCAASGDMFVVEVEDGKIMTIKRDTRKKEALNKTTHDTLNKLKSNQKSKFKRKQ